MDRARSARQADKMFKALVREYMRASGLRSEIAKRHVLDVTRRMEDSPYFPRVHPIVERLAPRLTKMMERDGHDVEAYAAQDTTISSTKRLDRSVPDAGAKCLCLCRSSHGGENLGVCLEDNPGRYIVYTHNEGVTRVPKCKRCADATLSYDAFGFALR